MFCRTPNWQWEIRCLLTDWFACDIYDALLRSQDSFASEKVELKLQVLVIQPLIPLMEDQTKYPQNLPTTTGKKINVARLWHERETPDKGPKEIGKELRETKPEIIFAWPEAVLDTHRSLIKSASTNIRLIATDEARCVVKW